MGPTPTRTPLPTLRMHLSCNFVNVYNMIAYHVQLFLFPMTKQHQQLHQQHCDPVLSRCAALKMVF